MSKRSQTHRGADRRGASSVAAVATAVAVQKVVRTRRPRRRRGRSRSPCRQGRSARRPECRAHRCSRARARPPPELRLPATAEPFAEARLYARINGFVAQQRAELGDRVAAGQVLAVIDAPEVEQAYERAKAALAAGRRTARALAQQPGPHPAPGGPGLPEPRLAGRAQRRAARGQRRPQCRGGRGAAAGRAAELPHHPRAVRRASSPSAGPSAATWWRAISRRRMPISTACRASTGCALRWTCRRAPRRSIRAGTPVEVVFPEFPGQVFAGRGCAQRRRHRPALGHHARGGDAAQPRRQDPRPAWPGK